MAVLVKNIEREFLLNAAMRERASLIMVAGGGEWNVLISAMDRANLTMSHTAPLALLHKGKILDFRYNVRGQTIAFKARILEPGDKTVLVSMPEALYKNLSRRYARLPPPGDLSVSFSFSGERYDLDFPQSQAYHAPGDDYLAPGYNPANLRGMMAEFESKASNLANEYGIVMYKNKKPQGPIEILACSTGRAFYMPNVLAGLPMTDPFSDRTILTKDDFLDYFMDNGVEKDYALDEVVRVERSRRNLGILSELLVPILFQDYAIGYVTLVNKQVSMPPFDLRIVETFTAFSRVLSWSLKLHGYFKDAPILDDQYKTEVLDVSAGGLLFACRDQRLISALKENMAVSVRIEARRRSVEATGTIRQHFAGGAEGCFGIEFTIMEPEDFRFLFEYLYGRPFTDDDAESIEGIRILKP